MDWAEVDIEVEVEVEVEVDPCLSELLSASACSPPRTGTAEPLLDPKSAISSSSLGGGAGNSSSSADRLSFLPPMLLTEVFLLPCSPAPVLPRDVVVVVVVEEMV